MKTIPGFERLRVDSRGVVETYENMALARMFNIQDFADGRYPNKAPRTEANYVDAQIRESNWLLDQVRCTKDSTVLEIGCGYARPLREALLRGAKGIGITITPHQVQICQEAGLEVLLMNYRDIPQGWNGMFDSVVANGPIEHFVQLENACQNHEDYIYREMFGIKHRVLKPGGRLVTTTIHFRNGQEPDPMEIREGKYVRWSTKGRIRKLVDNFPGWYPVCGQLEHSAKGLFRRIYEEDGTKDYRRTSEDWNHQFWRKMLTNPKKTWPTFLRAYSRKGKAWELIRFFVFDKDWLWQFLPGPNGQPPPMILLRKVWERVD